jgi:hypothetical protein
MTRLQLKKFMMDEIEDVEMMVVKESEKGRGRGGRKAEETGELVYLLLLLLLLLL